MFFEGITSEKWNQSTLIKPSPLSLIIKNRNLAVTAYATACAVEAY